MICDMHSSHTIVWLISSFYELFCDPPAIAPILWFYMGEGLYPLPHIKPHNIFDNFSTMFRFVCRVSERSQGGRKKVVFEAFSGVINRTTSHSNSVKCVNLRGEIGRKLTISDWND